MTHRAVIFLLFGVLLAVSQSAIAQIDPDGRSTKKELRQIREAARDYSGANSEGTTLRVFRVDLDGDGKKEAIVRFENSYLCGASSCTTIIITWIAGEAVVVSLFSDGGLTPLKSKTKGWHDLEGHYYNYKWNGDKYERVCQPDRACDLK